MQKIIVEITKQKNEEVCDFHFKVEVIYNSNISQ